MYVIDVSNIYILIYFNIISITQYNLLNLLKLFKTIFVLLRTLRMVKN